MLKADADNAYSTNPSAQVKLNATGQVALLIDIEDGQDITTADGLLEAISSVESMLILILQLQERLLLLHLSLMPLMMHISSM